MPPPGTKRNGHRGPFGRQPAPGQAEGLSSPADTSRSAQKLRHYCVGDRDADQVAIFVDLQRRLVTAASYVPNRPRRAGYRRRADQSAFCCQGRTVAIHRFSVPPVGWRGYGEDSPPEPDVVLAGIRVCPHGGTGAGDRAGRVAPSCGRRPRGPSCGRRSIAYFRLPGNWLSTTAAASAQLCTGGLD